MDLSYIINQLGEDREQYFNAIAPPIVQTSNFAFNTIQSLRECFENEMSGYLYSRGLNPTVDILRKKLAALDAAEDCLVFNSGAAAIFASVLAVVKQGDHIVSVQKPYTWAQKMFNNILPRFGVSCTYVDGTRIEHFEQALQPNTALIYLESPNSWTYELQDLRAVAALAKERNIITICDNSYCTPIYQRPVEMGIDMSLQSATKYISGHSDTVAGVLTGSAGMMKKIFDSEYMNIGSGIQPFNAWLLLRGLRTLPVRLEQISVTTKKITAWLKQHPQVEQVFFPFDEDFPQRALAQKQMSGACGLLTFILKAGSYREVQTFCETLENIPMAVSWGGYESLIVPGCAVLPEKDFNPAVREHRMIRLYVGLEEVAALQADIGQALKAM
jgi:cystathionine beta-lyase/cystathionine gamma-synthase